MVSVDDKRSMLEDAWNASQATTPPLPLRGQLRSSETQIRKALAQGSISHIGGSGRSTGFAGYGQGENTPLEVAQGYRELVDLYGHGLRVLIQCSTYGLDAFSVERDGSDQGWCYGTPLPPQVTPVVIVDTKKKWLPLCQEFSVIYNTVVGQAVGDAAIFLWTMYHLVPITEVGSDYTLLYVPPGQLQYA
jgi:hypothetical protein